MSIFIVTMTDEVDISNIYKLVWLQWAFQSLLLVQLTALPDFFFSLLLYHRKLTVVEHVVFSFCLNRSLSFMGTSLPRSRKGLPLLFFLGAKNIVQVEVFRASISASEKLCEVSFALCHLRSGVRCTVVHSMSSTSCQIPVRCY